MKVFSFTFLQHIGRKGYRIGTLAGMVLCFLLPLAGMVLAEHFSDRDESLICRADAVYVADQSANPLRDVSVLEAGRDESIGDAVFVLKPDFASAYEQAAQEEKALVAVIDESGNAYEVTVIRPSDSKLEKSDARALEAYLDKSFQAVMMAKSGLNPIQLMVQLTELNTPVSSETRTAGEESVKEAEKDTDPLAEVREILGMALPFLNIMLLYFLILFYGQSVTACILVEKTSKLMDTLLISVRPEKLLMGKVFATVLAAFLQVFAWLLALAGGLAAGTFAVRQMNPQTDMLLLQIFKGLKMFGGLFSVSGFLLGCVIILAGFLLYCSLAAVGGALAGKQEDLSATNMLYVLVLVASFFVTLQGTEIGTAQAWMNWVPFTAVLVTPARMLTGEVSFVQGLGSLTVILLTSVVIIGFAGRLYHAMALYKGNLPKPRQILAMLRGERKKR